MTEGVRVGAEQPPTGPGRFFGVSFSTEAKNARYFRRDELDRELADPEVFSWIDIEASDIEILNEVLRKLDIDLVLVSHFREPEVLPRIVERPDCLAFYVYEIDDPDSHLDTSRGLKELEFVRMIVVLGADFIITYHDRPLAAVEHVKASCEESFKLAGKTPGFISFLLLQQCLYDYAHLNLANDNYLDAIEAGVLTGDAKVVASKVAVAGSNILTLKRLVASLHIVLMLLVTKRSPFISGEGRMSFSEMLQNALAIRGAIDSSRDLLDGIVGSLQIAAANRTSEVAKVLTVLSGIMLPLSLVAGIYGMNFENMPELKWKYGYFYTLAGMTALGLLLLFVFRQLGWIGRKDGEER